MSFDAARGKENDQQKENAFRHLEAWQRANVKGTVEQD
jgi:hypothetical protein